MVNDLVVKTAICSPTPTPDRRGGLREGPNVKTVNKDALVAHILTFNPALPHYRRAHAPNRLYLPPDLTIQSMLNDYNERNLEDTVSYSTYEREVAKLNISFTRLSTEECEMCKTLSLSHTTHAGSRQCVVEDCGACSKQKAHDELKAESRASYKDDGEIVLPNTVVLQKVIMLPCLPGVKTACFTRRILAFHETFAPIGKYKAVIPTISCIWHEGISGRKAEDIASTFIRALHEDRDYQQIVYFADNCSAQNKNWYLFYELVNLINSDRISAQTITIKFLEAGHTFMSADSIHADVEKRVKIKKEILDFDDFAQCIRHRNINVLVINFSDFYHLKELAPFKITLYML